MEQKLNSRIITLLLIGFVLRLVFATLGVNFDLQSYWIVSQLVLDGQSVWANTARYNYGPIWFYILAALRWIIIQFDVEEVGYFHLTVVVFLCIVDIFIYFILAKIVGELGGWFYYLNPVTVLIIGYHSQFDNFAILVGLVAWGKISRVYLLNDLTTIRQYYLNLFLLGLSLMIKHVLFLLPLWIAFSRFRKSKKQAVWAILVPYGVFICGFLPWIGDPASLRGIFLNVFKYSSQEGNSLAVYFLEIFIRLGLIESIATGTKIIFILGLALSGIGLTYFLQKQNSEFLLIFFYLICMLILTSAMADQYLLIPLVACSVFVRNSLSWVYSLQATLIVLSSKDNLGHKYLPEWQGFFTYPYAQICMVALLFGLLAFGKLPESRTQNTELSKAT